MRSGSNKKAPLFRDAFFCTTQILIRAAFYGFLSGVGEVVIVGIGFGPGVGVISGDTEGAGDGDFIFFGVAVGVGVCVAPIALPSVFPLPAEKANVANATAASNTIDKPKRPVFRSNDVNFISTLRVLFLAGSYL
jgi:hypothetical protein